MLIKPTDSSWTRYSATLLTLLALAYGETPITRAQLHLVRPRKLYVLQCISGSGAQTEIVDKAPKSCPDWAKLTGRVESGFQRWS